MSVKGILFVAALTSLLLPLMLTRDLIFPSQLKGRLTSSSVLYSSSEVILQRVSENGTKECHNITTRAAYFFGLPMPGNEGPITMSTGVVHKFWIVSYAADGRRRCTGGDFYETDLSDYGNGSYLVELKVDKGFEGNYTLKAILLYSNFHGMDKNPEPWALETQVFQLQIHFVNNKIQRPSPLPLCTSKSLKSAKTWLGKWTRMKFDESCKLDEEGRYRCLPDDEQCDDSQCSGALERLESNGWVYSAHCKFRIWSFSDAWKCLDGKKLFFWGDSNHRDTVRNLVNFVLGHNIEIPLMTRTFTLNVTNPSNPKQQVRLFQVFNGHSDSLKNYMGLKSLSVKEYRELVKEEFFRGGQPDAVILNSGLHDGHAWKRTQDFAIAAEIASYFWWSLLGGDGCKARIVIRNTIATAGHARASPSNPQKMAAFNSILSDEFGRRLKSLENLMFVDNFDMTFPWHYNHDCSDGTHYGVEPSLSPWMDRVGHFNFVDLMLVHVLLTGICL
ncbi:uncharacterized protein LOC9659984 [Selaginella moellendorffii]|uniref:uncharacterized protein LOC9659984 n=1 Tax=Selaginella moellendorffii TaxID=88036 RepID=UPI000D1D07ED|nr:uncharacterized protein LOC9659984 [Selaginella moellendorffii]|eukprot:XP_024520474.1 uncharacterized protein LOC9659984 [Selaginella moellendorffii]